MKTSPQIQKLTQSLLEAQRQMGAAVKGAKNPFFKSSYADLPTVMEVVKEPLNNAGIIIMQPPANIDGKNFIETILIHAASGEWCSSETEVICAKVNDPQAFGAAQTYARRFGLQSMGFIPAEDDDGNTAAGRSVPKTTYTPTPSAKTATSELKLPLVGGTLEASPTVQTLAGELKERLSEAPPIPIEPLKKTSSFSKKNKAVSMPVPTPLPAAELTVGNEEW